MRRDSQHFLQDRRELLDELMIEFMREPDHAPEFDEGDRSWLPPHHPVNLLKQHHGMRFLPAKIGEHFGTCLQHFVSLFF